MEGGCRSQIAPHPQHQLGTPIPSQGGGVSDWEEGDSDQREGPAVRSGSLRTREGEAGALHSCSSHRAGPLGKLGLPRLSGSRVFLLQ